MGNMSVQTAVENRIQRLNQAAAKRVVDPDEEIVGSPGPGQVLPDELLSVAGLDLDLTPDQRAKLSREEVASIAIEGVRFEAVLTAGFGLQIAGSPSVLDPRVTFLLHEIGEETRHSRLFIRLIEALEPTADNPLDRPLFRRLMRIGVRNIIRRPALLYTLVLAGEEIPDLMQKLAAEHPETDGFVRDINRYHRMEEARHLSFARALLPEIWAKAAWHDRLAVRFVAPFVITGMFETLVHPGVYESIGLPGWPTWKAVIGPRRGSPAATRRRVPCWRHCSTPACSSQAPSRRGGSSSRASTAPASRSQPPPAELPASSPGDYVRLGPKAMTGPSPSSFPKKGRR